MYWIRLLLLWISRSLGYVLACTPSFCTMSSEIPVGATFIWSLLTKKSPQGESSHSLFLLTKMPLESSYAFLQIWSYFSISFCQNKKCHKFVNTLEMYNLALKFVQKNFTQDLLQYMYTLKIMFRLLQLLVRQVGLIIKTSILWDLDLFIEKKSAGKDLKTSELKNPAF